MKYYKGKDDTPEAFSPAGYSYWSLLDEENGCTNGCQTGITRYIKPEYTEKAYHDFQEGFYVISGMGYAIIGEETFEVHPGMSFIVPRQTSHQFRTDGHGPLEVFWFHAAG